MLGPGYGLADQVYGGMHYYDTGRRRRRGARHPYAVLLALQLFQKIADLKKIPPLTLALIVAMSLLHVKSDLFQDFTSSGRGGSRFWGWNFGGWNHYDYVHSVCLWPDAMWDTYKR